MQSRWDQSGLFSAIRPESVSFFHGKITREQAEELLTQRGLHEGLFLLRESVMGNFAISVCHKSRINHYNVERCLDGGYRIQSGPVFPGPIELVQHHSKNLDGFLTLTRLPLERSPPDFVVALQENITVTELEDLFRVKALEVGLRGRAVEEALNGPMRFHLRQLVFQELHFTQTWYHDDISRKEAESRLGTFAALSCLCNRDGLFLVRYRTGDDSYVLSLCFQNEAKHYKIERRMSKLFIEGGKLFDSVIEMIDHYHFRQDGLLCKLRKGVENVGKFTSDGRSVISRSSSSSRASFTASSTMDSSRNATNSPVNVSQHSVAATATSPSCSTASAHFARLSSSSTRDSVAMLHAGIRTASPVGNSTSSSNTPPRPPPAVQQKRNSQMSSVQSMASLSSTSSGVSSCSSAASSCPGGVATCAVAAPTTIAPAAAAASSVNAPLSVGIAHHKSHSQSSGQFSTTQQLILSSNSTKPPSLNQDEEIRTTQSPDLISFADWPHVTAALSGTDNSGMNSVAADVRPTRNCSVTGGVHNLIAVQSPLAAFAAERSRAFSPFCTNGLGPVLSPPLTSPTFNSNETPTPATLAHTGVAAVKNDADSLLRRDLQWFELPTPTPDTDAFPPPPPPLALVGAASGPASHITSSLFGNLEEVQSVFQPPPRKQVSLLSDLFTGDNSISSTFFQLDSLIKSQPATIISNPLLEQIWEDPEVSATALTSEGTNSSSEKNDSPNASTTHDSVDEFSDDEEAQRIYDSLPSTELSFNILPSQLAIKEKLGGGNFGQVMRALFKTSDSRGGAEIPVAVKMLRQDVASGEMCAVPAERELLQEARLMSQLRHRNIVRLLGVCRSEHMMLIMELVPLGPIHRYLKKHPDHLSLSNLTELAYQVAQGMAYLESCKFVHRDLAARNVLLANLQHVKISDFGMSKALQVGNDYYRASTAGKWPLKWYAPECIYYFRFDSKSDVWSFGVTLWEMFSYGGKPYKDMKATQILALLDEGSRLPCPPNCPETIFEIMNQCWRFEGVRRPHFFELVKMFSRLLCQQIPAASLAGLTSVTANSSHPTPPASSPFTTTTTTSTTVFQPQQSSPVKQGTAKHAAGTNRV